MKILLIGARGMLGTDLAKTLRSSYKLWEKDIEDLDICQREAVNDTIFSLQPDAVINCAAYTNVDACESYPEKAFAVNADGVMNIALACKKTGSVLYHISTDFVFDGLKRNPYSEADLTQPLSIYGKSKLAGEQFLTETLRRYVIIRTAWLFGKNGNNFIKTIINLSHQQDTLRIVNDQTGCPTYTVDLAQAIKQLITLPHSYGVYHICNNGQCTWHDLAVATLFLTGSKKKVIPITTQELGRPAARPAFSVLDCKKYCHATGMMLRKWQNAVEAYLNDLQGDIT